MQTGRRGGRRAGELVLVLLGLGERAQRRQTLRDELRRVEVGQVWLMLMRLLDLLLVVTVVVRRHLSSVRRRVVEAIAMGGVLLLLRRNG